jgi:hypothetical protein
MGVSLSSWSGHVHKRIGIRRRLEKDLASGPLPLRQVIGSGTADGFRWRRFITGSADARTEAQTEAARRTGLDRAYRMIFRCFARLLPLQPAT